MLKKNLKPEEIKRSWYIVDAQDYVLGRMATKVAQVLQGKNHPYYSPQWDMGDFVIVVNAEKVKLTGNKEEGKKYYHHTGFPGGIRSKAAGQVRKENPKKMIELAVRRMLPKNRLAKQMINKMHVYVGSEHDHAAQKPIELTV